MKLKNLLYILLALPFLWSCNDEDDIDEIFVSGTWQVVNFYTKVDWDKRNGELVYNDKDALQALTKLSLTFNNDGSFSATMVDGTFDGTWSAEGKDRTVYFKIKGSPSTSNRFNKHFIESLKEATYYQGDSNVLMIGPSDKRSYIQFRHN